MMTSVMVRFTVMVELLKRAALALFLSTLLTAVVILPLMLLACADLRAGAARVMIDLVRFLIQRLNDFRKSSPLHCYKCFS